MTLKLACVILTRFLLLQILSNAAVEQCQLVVEKYSCNSLAAVKMSSVQALLLGAVFTNCAVYDRTLISRILYTTVNYHRQS